MTRPNLLVLSIAAALVGAAYLSGSATALRPSIAPAPPTSVGVVNLDALFDRLDEAAEWDVKLRNLEAGVGAELQSRRAELEALGREIETMAEGPAKDGKIDDLRLMRLRIEQWTGMKELELDRERSLKWQSLYRAIREGAAKLSENEGYQLILVDDSKIEIKTQRGREAPPLETQAQGQIAALRVLHAARVVDVTEKLRVQINNARAAAPAGNR
ncbi:MAG: OmpH family outer membrane protein [Phycisphaerales bacterium]|jgi:Skp family chaperone for outer membrane proteins